MDIITITTENKLNNRDVASDGHYNIIKHGHSFIYDNNNTFIGKYIIDDKQKFDSILIFDNI